MNGHGGKRPGAGMKPGAKKGKLKPDSERKKTIQKAVRLTVSELELLNSVRGKTPISRWIREMAISAAEEIKKRLL